MSIVALKIEGKEMYPIFVFAKCCWLVHPKSGKAWRACAQQTEENHSHMNSAVSRQVCTCPASSAFPECIFSTRGLVYSPTTERGWVQRRQKIG